MSTNRDVLKGKSLIERTDFALSNLSSGGLLATEVYNKFIQIAQNSTPVLKAARRVDMKSHTTKIPKITFASRIMKANPGSNTPLDPADRAAPTTSDVTLTSKEINGEVDIPYEVLEDNVEKENFETTLLEQIAIRFGLDLEELFLAGDTGSGDAYLAVMDGWLKKITSNVVNASTAALSAALLDAARVAVPLRFRQRGRYLNYVEDHAAETWRQLVGQRATILGDKYAIEGGAPPHSGSPVMAVGQMPVVSGSPNTSTAVFTDPSNLVFGVWREVEIRPWDYPPNRQIKFLIRARVACAVEQEDAAAKITNVKAA
jgi:HK97 family phage major capsid protein